MVIDVTCPACWQPTAVEIVAAGEEGVEEVEQWEDCQVCCRPMRLTAQVSGGQLVSIEVDEDG